MRRLLLSLASVVAGLLLLSGCSKQPETPQPGPESPAPVAVKSSPAASKPAASPEVNRVPVIVLGDKRCKDRSCDTRRILNSLKVMIPGLVIQELDWSSPEGKAAYAEHGLRHLPAFIFDASLKAEVEATKRLGRFLKPSPKQGFQVLQLRAIHDPEKEICDNKVDDTGNGKADCNDDDCKSSMVCRKEIKGDLQLFVMSQCPFGIKALDAMQEVLKAFGSEIKFDVHFIASENGSGFRSLHGQAEVDEDIRELCAKKLAPKDYGWMKYIWCRNKDIHSAAFEGCLSVAGIKPAAFKACATGEKGKQLLREDIGLAQALGFSASPSWLVNNRTKISGLDPRTIQTGICKQNPKLAGCKAQLTGPAPKKSGGGGCGCGGGGSCGG